MNTDLLNAAAKVIPDQQILINVVSRRVRQLCLGHRPLLVSPPGLRAADIALLEIINKKLTFELTGGKNATEPRVVPFPGVLVEKEKAA